MSRWYGALEPEGSAPEPEGSRPDADADAGPPGAPLLSVQPADAVEGRRTGSEPESESVPTADPSAPAEPGADAHPPLTAEVVEPVMVEPPVEPVVIAPAGSDPGPADPAPEPPPPVIDAEVVQVDTGAKTTTPLDEIDDELKFPWEAEAEAEAAADVQGDIPRLRPAEPLDDADLFGDADLADTVTPLDARRAEREQWENDDRFDNYVPSDVTTQRSEFVGGWSDWVGPGSPPAASPPGWEDDGTVRTLPSPLALREQDAPPDSRRRRAFVVLGVAVLLLVLAAVGVVYLLGSGGGGGGSAPVVPSAMQFSSAGGPAAECTASRTPTEVRGAGRGGAMSGPDAILAFQYAYYVDRSGSSARQLVAPGAAVSPAEVIQRGIDSIPAGTTHCVRITEVGDNRYSVEVTEQRPGGVPASYSRQTVTTAEIGGRTLITGIAAG
ncbi:hypothetical protein [Nocardia harenae]|uniref:hypothetical protein n=1 Tax=Nocardia harenae TaxID=358707 RepID=UPI00082C2DD6|nr:hypothetical protein [Nocardia harenae]